MPFKILPFFQTYAKGKRLAVTRPSNFTVTGKFVKAYTGGRTKDEFIKFMDEHTKGSAQGEPPKEVLYEDKDSKKDEL